MHHSILSVHLLCTRAQLCVSFQEYLLPKGTHEAPFIYLRSLCISGALVTVGQPRAQEAILVQDEETLEVSYSCSLCMLLEVICASYSISSGENVGDTEFTAWENSFYIN